MEKITLTGTVLKALTVPAYTAMDFADAVRQGRFNNDTANIVYQFREERVGLAVPAQVDIVEFNRNWYMDEAIAWGKKANGNKKPIGVAHLMGIAIGLPDEQREWPIVEIGSVSGVDVLYLNGGFNWRDLNCHAVESYWFRHDLVGFVSLSA